MEISNEYHKIIFSDNVTIPLRQSSNIFSGLHDENLETNKKFPCRNDESVVWPIVLILLSKNKIWVTWIYFHFYFYFLFLEKIVFNFLVFCSLLSSFESVNLSTSGKTTHWKTTICLLVYLEEMNGS